MIYGKIEYYQDGKVYTSFQGTFTEDGKWNVGKMEKGGTTYEGEF